MKYLLIILLSIGSVGRAEGVLDPTEKQIVRSVDANQSQALSLLEKAVNINSGTMNFPGVMRVAGLFAKELELLGFHPTTVEGHAFGRAGHLVASRGTQGSRILLIGHLDTVFEPADSFQTFERIDERYARGPGVTDMKGGDVVLIYALRALYEAGVLDELQIRVVMTGDEESRGKPHAIANKALIDAAIWADYAIGFEDGDGNPETAVVSRRGASGWQLEVSGRPAHSSQIFQDEVGYGAVFEAARILDQFRTVLAGVPNLTFNPGMIAGGTELNHEAADSRATAFGKSNVVAKTVVVTGGIRALSPAQLQMAQETMQDIVAANLAHTQARLVFDDGYPPMSPSAGNSELLRRYSDVSVALGLGPVRAVDPRRAGAADISFVAGHVKMAIDGLGLMGSGGHTVNETADLYTLPSQTKRAALLMYRLR